MSFCRALWWYSLPSTIKKYENKLERLIINLPKTLSELPRYFNEPAKWLRDLKLQISICLPTFWLSSKTKIHLDWRRRFSPLFSSPSKLPNNENHKVIVAWLNSNIRRPASSSRLIKYCQSFWHVPLWTRNCKYSLCTVCSWWSRWNFIANALGGRSIPVNDAK